MSSIEYRVLNQVNPDPLLSLLNKKRIRSHLVSHQRFDRESLQLWIKTKIEMDATPGCRVRAIMVDGHCIGWCGIQHDSGEYEIAVVLDDSHWGLGRRIFRDLMTWAKELGHKTVSIHFLHTRPEYKFLKKIAQSMHESQILGNRFTTYTLAVE
ncbi:MAG: GNAT family N-acetyltransferase [Zhongshania sp.]|uniref:GNAT family N-acetyltransferase n=1 Tax=Zhongshania sp. TaxID=1971902 RepID=UPI00261079FB|nr:GNAT family N-acetyltransferase [Zhongshania sp.]MDF1693342.1 GNAT family N-acetyltransferase [Zhongshania sp.]